MCDYLPQLDRCRFYFVFIFFPVVDLPVNYTYNVYVQAFNGKYMSQKGQLCVFTINEANCQKELRSTKGK